MKARALALAAGLVVVLGYPLVRMVARVAHPAPGDLDLSDAWAWPPVVVAGLATSAAVFFWGLHRDAANAATAVYETFEYHDAMLQKMVVARMALDLDEPVRAGQVLDTVIAAASGVITSLVDPDGAVPLVRAPATGVDQRNRATRASSSSLREQGVGMPFESHVGGARQ